MSSVTIAKLLAVLAAIAGVTGSVLTPVLGNNLATAVQVVLQAVSGLLVLIAGTGAVVTLHAAAQAEIAGGAK
jgi:hypothetical protein